MTLNKLDTIAFPIFAKLLKIVLVIAPRTSDA